MARPLRIQYPEAFYHVTSRGNERKAIFRNDRDRNKFLSYLETAHERYGAIIHVYCLMDNITIFLLKRLEATFRRFFIMSMELTRPTSTSRGRGSGICSKAGIEQSWSKGMPIVRSYRDTSI
jgi:REP element-mobilizing transposase RayT